MPIRCCLLHRQSGQHPSHISIAVAMLIFVIPIPLIPIPLIPPPSSLHPHPSTLIPPPSFYLPFSIFHPYFFLSSFIFFSIPLVISRHPSPSPSPSPSLSFSILTFRHVPLSLWRSQYVMVFHKEILPDLACGGRVDFCK